MKTNFAGNCLIVLSLTSVSVNCQPNVNPTSLILTPFASGFNQPVDISNAGDDRLFIVEQAGFIKIVSVSGNVNTVPFLDIDDRVKSGGEQGLLGLAFHPNYSENGFFYVNYTGAGDSTHISRFSVNPANPDLADTGSEMKLMTIYQPFQNHNGGDLVFGPDGYLYIGLGDGGSAGDPGNRAQNPMEYLGKMLRIDVDGGLPYSIPETNPYYGNPSVLNEIWALGLRNPWRFSFDKLTGDLWIGDVGQNAIEEIDFQPASSQGGENYGWRCYEGNDAYNTEGCLPENNYTFPVHSYSHSATNSCSVTGGFVYRGSQFPNYYGKYFFADYCSDKIWTLVNESGTWTASLMGQFSGNNFSTFGEGVDGRLYIAGHSSGIIFQIGDTEAGGRDYLQKDVFKIYPNPFHKSLMIETDYNNSTTIQLNIFDLAGHEVFASDIATTLTKFNLGFLPSGIYFVYLIMDDRVQVDKLIKQ
jgi:glucose/arabinose dehydrogenase